VTYDIADLLADAVDERARTLDGLRPTPAAFALTRVRIRRRRIVRHSVEAGAGLAASGVVAAGALFASHLDRTPTPPAVTPSTSVSPTPTPTPTPATTATGGPTASGPTTSAGPAVTPTVTPGLPAALPAPDGLLATTRPGWVLSIYRSAPANPAAAITAVHTVIAIAPDGTRYRLADLPPDQSIELLDWHAGDTQARVGYGQSGVDGSLTGWLDLRTGALTRDEPAIPAGHSFEARLSDGTELWTANLDPGPVQLWAVPQGGAARLVGQMGDSWTKPRVNPSQTRVAALAPTADSVIVLDLATGARSTVPLAAPGADCALLGWSDDRSVVVSCFDYVGPDPIVQRNPRLVLVDVESGATTTVTRLGVGQPLALSGSVGITVTPGTLAFPAYTLDAQVPMADLCPNGLWEWSGSGLRVVPVPGGSDTFRIAAARGDLYVAASAGCTATIAAPTLERVAADGTTTVLAPAPEPLTGIETTTTLSWVVGH
jgi:hypothetical protein